MRAIDPRSRSSPARRSSATTRRCDDAVERAVSLVPVRDCDGCGTPYLQADGRQRRFCTERCRWRLAQRERRRRTQGRGAALGGRGVTTPPAPGATRTTASSAATSGRPRRCPGSRRPARPPPRARPGHDPLGLDRARRADAATPGLRHRAQRGTGRAAAGRTGGLRPRRHREGRVVRHGGRRGGLRDGLLVGALRGGGRPGPRRAASGAGP